MQCHWYLAYGSNLHPARLARRVAASRVVRTVALPGWSLQFHKHGQDGSGKCNLVEDARDCAHGVLYEISAAAKCVLDEIEGIGRGYVERRIPVEDLGEVFFYAAMADYIDAALRPYDWYKELVLAGLRYHRMPAAYIDAVAATPSITDPDPARAALHRAILATLSVS